MKFFRSMANKFTIGRELVNFLWERKLWWMIPTIVLLLAFGILIVFAQTSPLAPFIYTLW